MKIREDCFKDLISNCGDKVVGDAYRRDLSTVEDENAFLNILHEIVLCASLSKIVPELKLRPAILGKRPDLSFKVEGVEVFGEVKRLIDRWWIDSDNHDWRLVSKTPTGEIPPGCARPRSEELYGKFINATRQFPDGKVNLFFVFTSSFGQEINYLQQALFGDANFLRGPHEIVLDNDGLFSTPEGMVLSGCCLVRDDNGEIVLSKYWRNQNTKVPLPPSVEKVLKKLAIGNMREI